MLDQLMIKKLYTLTSPIDVLKEIDNNGEKYTAVEHAYITKMDFEKNGIKTKEDILRHYQKTDHVKLGSLSFLIEEINKKGYNNILSLGAGQCVLEYLLKLSLPEKVKVIACDYDSFLITKAKDYFPNIITDQFDFISDDIKFLQSKLNIEFDLVVFFGSAYVMDNMEFIKVFGNLKKAGIKQLIDFHAGYNNLSSMFNIYYIRPFLNNYLSFKRLLKSLKENFLIRKIFNKPLINLKNSKNYFQSYRGKFHGYSRNKSELRRIYKNAGWKLKKETSVTIYEYVAILE